MNMGDIVTYTWGNKTHEGFFLRFEERGPSNTKCAIVDIEGKGEVAVRPELIVHEEQTLYDELQWIDKVTKDG